MVKAKGNIFGKKENKSHHEKSTEKEGLTEDQLTDGAEKMSASDDEQPSEVTSEVTAEPTAEPIREISNKEEEYKVQLKELQDKYVRLMAEFDNFRKRSLKERSELIKSAGEDILVSILPVIDDFERGLSVMETAQDLESVKQGVLLIYNKFKDFLSQRGVKEIEASKQDFNVDVHEAITKIPAPEEELKGKVVDVIQKGYSLNDKVIRYAKVVVGE
ncbi:MAG TPA: nucleotide exchange factor GrpE [Bacteroidales bacterium]